MRLLLLTGFRISEGQGLEREWVSAAEGYVGFPDTEGDAQVRAIGLSAVKLIAQQPVRVNSPYVFPSEVGEGHYTAGKACLERLCASVGIEGVTPHTLRHTFASVAGDLGFSELTIRALLGHGSPSVTQDYIHVDDLIAGMGVGRQSLYAVFGDKRTIFLRVLRAYAETKGARAAARGKSSTLPAV